MEGSEVDPLGLVGVVLDQKYELEAAVACGGFSIVYRARHRLWKKPVAIKFFHLLSSASDSARQELEEAFVREGALLSELSSECAAVVQAWDAGTLTADDGLWLPYMALEWIEGDALDSVLDRLRAERAAGFSFDQVHRILAPVAAALETAHRRGIAHRDVKPANVMLAGDPWSPSGVKLLDFGVAKVMAEWQRSALVRTGSGPTPFTPQYAAPEQFHRSYGSTGPWTDVHALALIAVEMLAGRPALEGEDVVKLGAECARPERPTPKALGVTTPEVIERVFAHALALRPEARFTSAGAFWSAFAEALEHPSLSAITLRGPGMSHASDTAKVKDLRSSQPGSMLPLETQGSLKPDSGDDGSTRIGRFLARAQSVVLLQPRSFRLFVGSSFLAVSVLALGAALLTRGPPARESPPPASLARVRPAALVEARRPRCPERMALIPSGQFFQGSDQSDALDHERPSFHVTVGAFCLDLTEVTVRDYRTCANQGRCRRALAVADWPGITNAQRSTYAALCNGQRADRDEHPVNCADFDMAQRFCASRGARLPTEAEWEYAARGPDGRVYPWGDEAPTALHLNACGGECVAWGRPRGEPLAALYSENDGYVHTAPVGRFPRGRSRFGPVDIVGNVWEWVADWYAPYTPDPKRNPRGPSAGEKRVVRGGAWNGSETSWLRPSFRYAQVPQARSHGIGFRCAADAL